MNFKLYSNICYTSICAINSQGVRQKNFRFGGYTSVYRGLKRLAKECIFSEKVIVCYNSTLFWSFGFAYLPN